MARLVKVVTTWIFYVFTPDILLVFAESSSEGSNCPSNILAFWEILALIFVALPVINNVLRLAVNRISNLVTIAGNLTRDLGGR